MQGDLKVGLGVGRLPAASMSRSGLVLCYSQVSLLTKSRLPGTEPRQGSSDEDAWSQPFKSNPEQAPGLQLGVTCRASPLALPCPPTQLLSVGGSNSRTIPHGRKQI